MIKLLARILAPETCAPPHHIAPGPISSAAARGGGSHNASRLPLVSLLPAVVGGTQNFTVTHQNRVGPLGSVLMHMASEVRILPAYP